MLEQIMYLVGFGIWIYLLCNCLYLLVFALAGHLGSKKLTCHQPVLRYRKFCVLMPAYKADEVVLESSITNLKQQYQGDFEIYVVADGLKPETLQTLHRQGVNYIEVSFDKSTKGKALLAAFNALEGVDFDAAVVLDVDNVMGANVLHHFNTAFEAGYRVAQAHRIAKNTETPFALLDACNEEINNHIFRKGHFALGMSPSLIGSGMAFEFSYLKQLLQHIGDTIGEDKEIDVRILRDKIRIAYLNQSYVYDEKTDGAAGFTQQRTRWIATQVDFLQKYALEGFLSLFKHRNREFFDKIVQSLLLPRTILLGLVGLLTMVAYIISFGPTFSYWATLLGVLSTTLLIALPRRLYSRQLLRAVLTLPYATICMLMALLNIGKAKQSFMPTQHKASSTARALHLADKT